MSSSSLQYITARHINQKAWNECIEQAVQAPFYGYGWYLDAVTDGNWSGLIYQKAEKYVAVMPLPVQKIGLKPTVVLPPLVQQLGFFCLSGYEHLETSFIQLLSDKIAVRSYAFNYRNGINKINKHKPDYAEGFTRINCILPLNKPYEELRKGFHRMRRADLNKAKRHQLIVREGTLDVLIEHFKEAKPELLTAGVEQKIRQIYQAAAREQKGFVLEAIDAQNNWHAGAFILQRKNRLLNLFNGVSAQGRKSGATTFIFDYLIERHAQSDVLLDFEGGNQSGAYSFYSSFGGTEETFIYWQSSRWRAIFEACKHHLS